MRIAKLVTVCLAGASFVYGDDEGKQARLALGATSKPGAEVSVEIGKPFTVEVRIEPGDGDAPCTHACASGARCGSRHLIAGLVKLAYPPDALTLNTTAVGPVAPAMAFFQPGLPAGSVGFVMAGDVANPVEPCLMPEITGKGVLFAVTLTPQRVGEYTLTLPHRRGGKASGLSSVASRTFPLSFADRNAKAYKPGAGLVLESDGQLVVKVTGEAGHSEERGQ